MRRTFPPAFTALVLVVLAATVVHAREVDREMVPSGILYDRVTPLSHIERFSGSPGAPPAGAAVWRQMLHELSRAALDTPAWPSVETVRAESRRLARRGVFQIGVINVAYERVRPEAVADGSVGVVDGRLDVRGGNPFSTHRAFAAAALADYSYRGADLTLVVDRRWYVTNDPRVPVSMSLDADDGRGPRPVTWGEAIRVSYPATGPKTIRVLFTMDDGTVYRAATPIDVRALVTPLPTDTIPLTASIPYDAVSGTGEAFVYLADGHATIVKPVVVVEGFDIDNSLNWDELYALLNDENLLEDLRADGFDVIVLNFTDAGDYIQRNSFVLVELLEQLQAMMNPAATFTLAGASMGGLVGRYALAYMETNAIPHQVNTFIAFDTPNKGANIPLGIQYWLDFFAPSSADAAYLLSRLDTPAARQMLVYHHTTPPGVTGEADPLRADLANDFTTVGDYPSIPRLVAVANGSAAQADQGFAAGDQIISWNYDILFVVVKGNVWAVPDGVNDQIFEGVNQQFFSGPTLDVFVSGTDPYDNAPGGSRATMAQMDSVAAPAGDIIALHDSHCFIPTISALALDTDDLFYDIAGDPNIMSHTPFDTVYAPAANQPHVDVTPENVVWLKSEIQFIGPPPSAAGPLAASPAPSLEQNVPNPFNPSTTIRFYLPHAADVRLDVFDVGGHAVAVLASGRMPAGDHAIPFDAHRLASGVYFYRLNAGAYTLTRQMTLVK